MKRWGWIVAILVVAFGGAFAWFWSLASVPAEEARTVSLHVEQTPVQVKRASETDFRDASEGMTLAVGDVVRTGENGKAVIELFGQSETRLDVKSELTITEASSDTAGSGAFSVRLQLSTGRVWSRVLKLLDLDSSFEVAAPSVVATVRGTAFDVRANGDGTSEVWVSDSVVSVNAPGAESDEDIPGSGEESYPTVTSTPALAAGESAKYGKNGKAEWRRPISSEDRASVWFANNAIADGVFVKTARDRLRDELERLDGNDGFTGATALSERLHLALTKSDDQKDGLLKQYLVRRIGRVITLAESGKSGLAAQEFSRLEKDIQDRLKGKDAEKERRRLLIALSRVDILVQDAAPGSPLYPLKQRLEDLAMSARQSVGPAEGLFARLLAVDARLGEAERFLNDPNYRDAETALNAARSGIVNARRDAQPFLNEIDPARKRSLRGKLLAMSVREAAARKRLRIAQQPEAALPSATSTTDGVPTSTSATTPKPKPTTPEVTPTQPSASIYAGIALSVQPNPINVGAGANLYAIATKINGGGTEDVTSRSTFRIVQGAGTLSGARFTATTPGTIVFEASFADQGKTVIARTSLTVDGGLATLESITVAASAGAPKPGERVTLSATAHYTNGFQKSVSATWKNLNPSLGTIAGNVFTPVTTASGQAELEATYTEEGVTKTDSVYVTVTAAPVNTRGVPNN